MEIVTQTVPEKEVEKTHGARERHDAEKHAFGIDAGSSGVVVVRDNAILHPQPTADPCDPLNWSRLKKHTILGIVMYLYFMFTYITTTTVPSFADLQAELGISYSQVNWTVAIPALGLSVGPLFWSSLADIYGRRIIFIVGTIIALASTIGAAKPNDYGGYMAARFFQGFGVSPAATVGLAVVKDMFFEHERGQKVGLWVLALDSGLLVGPIVGGFLNLLSSAWIQWFTAILFGFVLLLEVCFMTETLYPRSHMLSLMPIATVGSDTIEFEKMGETPREATEVDIKRTAKLPILNIRPVPGIRHPKPWTSMIRFILTFKHPLVVIAVGTYCFAWYWWILSIITMIPAAYVQYSPQIQGLLFLGLLLGTLFSEVFCSGALSDYIVARLARKNNAIRVPEMRLWLAYPAILLTAIGLILWGISIDKGYHWMVGQVAFFLCAAGIQIGNTVIASYIVDSYPLQSMSVITFYAVLINLSAFVDPFFIAPWQAASGFTWSFAAQGIITFFFSVPAVAILHRYGPLLRKKSGPMGWVDAEYDNI